MRRKTSLFVAFAMTAATSPVLADLVVTTDLGTYASSSVTALSGTTVGQPNNAFVYSSTSNTSTSLWGNGEYVYQFQLTKPAFLYLSDTTEPDADGTFPDPNNDYFLLNTLVTTNSNNTSTTTNANFGTWANKPEGTNLALVQNSMQSGTAGSSANIGMFRSSATNPYGIYPAGTYYISVDSSSGSINSYGLSNQLPAGSFTANLHVKYLDEVTAPASSNSSLTTGTYVEGSYAPGEVKFFAFDYAGGGFRLDTEGNTLTGAADTFLALYDAEGKLIKFNDDVGQNTSDPDSVGLPWAWSRLIVADGEIPVGKYYVGFTEYKAEANPGFDLRVYPASVGQSGTFRINGLSLARIIGDTNNDGVVDLVDLNNVLNNFGASGSNVGDDNGDMVVDLVDLNNVLNNFGATSASGSLSVVPEPASAAICGLGGLAFLARRRRPSRP